MSIYISNDIEQECLGVIAMFKDVNYVKEKILRAYPNLSYSKQKSVAKIIKSHIDQGTSFLEATNDNILTAPLTFYYAVENYAKAIYLVNFPNLTGAGSHGLDTNGENIRIAEEVGEIECIMNGKGTFHDLVSVTGEDLNSGDVFSLRGIFSIIPELREVYYLRYFEEPNLFLLKETKQCISEFDVVIQDDNVDGIKGRDYSYLSDNSFHLEFSGQSVYLWIDANYTEERGKCVTYNDVYGNLYCTNAITVNGRLVKISKIASMYICYYVFGMLARYYPEKWYMFCGSADTAIIRKMLVNCRREMLVEICQLLTGKEYSFTTYMEKNEAEIDGEKVFEIVRKKAHEYHMRTGNDAFLF